MEQAARETTRTSLLHNQLTGAVDQGNANCVSICARPRTNRIPTCCLRHARSSAQVADAMRRVFARRLVHPRFATVSSGEAAPQPPCISHARPDSPPPAASASSASLTEHMPRVASPSPASPNALRLTSSHHSAFAFAYGGSGRKARAQPLKLAFTGCAGNVDSL